VKVTVTFEDTEEGISTVFSSSCGDSVYEECSFPQDSVLQLLDRALRADGYSFPEGCRLAIYNEKTKEVRF
jgi:hypothetical protein